MSTFTPRFAPFATALAVAALTVPFAASAMARSSKATTIKLPASMLKDPAVRLCIAKSVIQAAAADQPATVCQTQAAWAAAGVTILAR